MSEDKKSLIDLVPDSVDNAVKNITDKPTQNIGATLADIWYLVFGGISQAADKRKLKYSYALQKMEAELKEEITKIPQNKFIDPDMQVIAPALESAKYCIEKEELRHMFSKLIASSMNEDFYNYVHPSFSMILQHLSVFDAKIFNIIYNNEMNKFSKLISDNADSFPKYIDQLSTSLMILRNFGLISGKRHYQTADFIDTGDVFSSKCIYYLIADTVKHEDESVLEKIIKYHDAFHIWDPPSQDSIRFQDSMYFIEITPLGNNFGKCCCK